jgi:iron complex transport system ATP-binding protein
MNLTVDNLAFGYPGKPVGRAANLSIRSGEILCLLGPNGSGKTTLFKTILGLLAPQGGRVRLDGEDLSRWSRARIAQVMGYVPQAHTAYFPFSVIETVVMGRSPHVPLFGTPSDADVAVADRALATLNIHRLRDAVYTRISGGERQLALIARALAQEPAVLVMDEPTASLDFGNQMLVLDQIRRLAARGMAIILSTHDPDHAFLCATQVALLHEGELVAQGSPGETITPETLRRLYGVNVDVLELPPSAGQPARPSHVCVPAGSRRDA